MRGFGFFIAAATSALATLGTTAWADPMTDKYTDVQAFLRNIAESHRATAELFDLAVSDSGQMIQGLRIGSGPVANLLVATHHGNEYGSTEVAKAFAESVAADPIAGQTLYVIPVLNTQGYDFKSRGENTPDSSQDPNRDYPGPCGTGGPFRLKSTAALAAFVDQKQIVTTATLHTYHPAVVYPWGFGTADFNPPYLDLFKLLVAAATEESHYATGNSTDVIYPAAGTYEDYVFWRHGVWSILFELGRSHKPYGDALVEMIRDNVPGLRRMFAKAPAARAVDHEFHGRCEQFKSSDPHDE